MKYYKSNANMLYDKLINKNYINLQENNYYFHGFYV